MRYLLDTNTIIALLNDSTSVAAQRIRREQPSDVAVSAVAMHELFYGAYKSQRVTQNIGLIDALQFAVLEFDKDDGRKAGEIRAFLAAKGTPIGPYDVLVAGQAAARNLVLVTNNTSEFSRVPGLRIADWHA